MRTACSTEEKRPAATWASRHRCCSGVRLMLMGGSVVAEFEAFFDALQAEVVVAQPPEHVRFVIGVLGVRDAELNDVMLNIGDLLLHGGRIGAECPKDFKGMVFSVVGHGIDYSASNKIIEKKQPAQK